MVDEPQACLLDKSGYLSVETYGSLASKLDIKGDKLRCIGKLDALNSRSRLAFFIEPDSAGTNLVFVVGLEGVDEQVNQPGVPSNLTILDQDNGLFFGTQGVGRCWTDLTLTLFNSHEAPIYRAEGELYCSSAIAQIQGPGFNHYQPFSFCRRLSHKLFSSSQKWVSRTNERRPSNMVCRCDKMRCHTLFAAVSRCTSISARSQPIKAA